MPTRSINEKKSSEWLVITVCVENIYTEKYRIISPHKEGDGIDEEAVYELCVSKQSVHCRTYKNVLVTLLI